MTKTGKRWYLVPRPKRSVCVESRKEKDRYYLHEIADWCYSFLYPSPWARAQECNNICK